MITVVRAHGLRAARWAGHADPSYYYQTARNLASGRGFTSDFVWHFLWLPPSVHHYAGDYWQPLPSFLLAIPMALTGQHNVGTAASASVVASALATLVAGVLAFHLTGRHAVAGMTVVVVSVLPRISFWSVQTESVPFYLLFVLSALAVATGRRGDRWRWAGAGACAAAAWLCRNDGLLLVLVLGAAQTIALLGVLRAGRPAITQQLLRMGSYIGGALVVLSPWLVANERAMHRLLPPTTQLPFLTSYEQLFQVGRHAGFHDLVKNGVGKAVDYRLREMRILWRVVPNSLTHLLLWVLVGLAALNVLALLQWRRRPQASPAKPAPEPEPEPDLDPEPEPAPHPRSARSRIGWPTVLASGLCVFLFDAIVSPVASQAGAWSRSLTAFLPILVIAAVAGTGRLPWVRLPLWIATAVLVSLPLFGANPPVAAAVNQNNMFGGFIVAYAGLIHTADPSGHAVVMTREPWETTEVTGDPSVQIPDNDFCTVMAIAHRYRASVFITHITRPMVSRRILRKAGFTVIGTSGVSTVLRFPPHVPGCTAANSGPLAGR